MKDFSVAKKIYSNAKRKKYNTHSPVPEKKVIPSSYFVLTLVLKEDVRIIFLLI